MANTNTLSTLMTSPGNVLRYINIDSDGTEETDLVVYDSSVIATALGLTDTLMCHILSIYATVSAAATARVELRFDATTDVLALDIPVGQVVDKNFRYVGGLENRGGSGITGDITLTTTGLESGDNITLILEVKPS